jgi:hypothetical protein
MRRRIANMPEELQLGLSLPQGEPLGVADPVLCCFVGRIDAPQNEIGSDFARMREI